MEQGQQQGPCTASRLSLQSAAQQAEPPGQPLPKNPQMSPSSEQGRLDSHSLQAEAESAHAAKATLFPELPEGRLAGPNPTSPPQSPFEHPSAQTEALGPDMGLQQPSAAPAAVLHLPVTPSGLLRQGRHVFKIIDCKRSPIKHLLNQSSSLKGLSCSSAVQVSCGLLDAVQQPVADRAWGPPVPACLP